MQKYLLPIGLLAASNVFMTVAWYWHLKFRGMPIVSVIFISWGIALVEYALAVPANRIGYSVYTAAQLRTIQEVITLTVFVGFSAVYLGVMPSWNAGIGFVLIALGAFFVFRG